MASARSWTVDHLPDPSGKVIVVTVSSIAHRFGAIRFDDLHSRDSYNKWRAYGQSKLANLLFTYELPRRLHSAGATGALPTRYTAAAADVCGGDFIGPDGFQEMWGSPKKVVSNDRSHDRHVAQRLWETSEELTGVRYQGLRP